MASSRRKAVNENISTYGAPGFGRDYTSMSSWEGATDNDLVSATQSEVLECYDDAAGFDEIGINLSGATCNASYFRIIRPAGVKGQASWQGHDGTPNNGFTISSAQDDDMMEISDSFCQVQDIIFNWNAPGAANRIVALVDGASAGFIGCIIKYSDSGGGARGFSLRGQSCYAVNCLAQDVERFGFDLNPNSAGWKVYALNCTAVNNGEEGFLASSGETAGAVAVNCLAYGNAGEDFEDPSANPEWDLTNSRNNASEDAQAGDFTNGRANQTFTFKNVGTDDFHLRITDAGARNFGFNLSATGAYQFSDDIDFRPRAFTWDIGFDEYFSPYPIISDQKVTALIFGNRIVR